MFMTMPMVNNVLYGILNEKIIYGYAGKIK